MTVVSTALLKISSCGTPPTVLELLRWSYNLTPPDIIGFSGYFETC